MIQKKKVYIHKMMKCFFPDSEISLGEKAEHGAYSTSMCVEAVHDGGNIFCASFHSPSPILFFNFCVLPPCAPLTRSFELTVALASTWLRRRIINEITANASFAEDIPSFLKQTLAWCSATHQLRFKPPFQRPFQVLPRGALKGTDTRWRTKASCTERRTGLLKSDCLVSSHWGLLPFGA